MALVFILLLVAFFVFAPRVADWRLNRVYIKPPYQAAGESREVHERVQVADLHSDFLLWKRDLLRRHSYGHVDLPRLIEGNVSVQVFSVVTKAPRGLNYQETEDRSDNVTWLQIAQLRPLSTWTSLYARALYQARRLHDAERRSQGRLVILRKAEDLERHLDRRAAGSKSVAGLLALEGLHALEGDESRVEMLFETGFRMMAPVHMFDNDVAGASSGVEKYGLTPFGRRVLARMEALGVIVDLAHASPRTFDDVLDAVSRPVVVSHAGVRATYDSPRNLSDGQIRRLASGGGIVGIGCWDQAIGGSRPEDVVRAIRHVVDLVGIDHVALGTDFDGTVRTVFDASGYILLTEALLKAGFSDEDVRLVMGGNVIRLLASLLP